MTVLALARDNVILKPMSDVALVCSATDASSMLTVGGSSSSAIVPVPNAGGGIVGPPVAFVSCSVKLSSFSSVRSPTSCTVTCLVVSPGANVSVVFGTATKSRDDVAVTLLVWTSTVTVLPAASESVTVKTIDPAVPGLPSGTAAGEFTLNVTGAACACAIGHSARHAHTAAIVASTARSRGAGSPVSMSPS